MWNPLLFVLYIPEKIDSFLFEKSTATGPQAVIFSQFPELRQQVNIELIVHNHHTNHWINYK